MPASPKLRNSTKSSQSSQRKKRKSRVGGKYNPRLNNYNRYIYQIIKSGIYSFVFVFISYIIVFNSIYNIYIQYSGSGLFNMFIYILILFNFKLNMFIGSGFRYVFLG